MVTKPDQIEQTRDVKAISPLLMDQVIERDYTSGIESFEEKAVDDGSADGGHPAGPESGPSPGPDVGADPASPGSDDPSAPPPPGPDHSAEPSKEDLKDRTRPFTFGSPPGSDASAGSPGSSDGGPSVGAPGSSDDAFEIDDDQPGGSGKGSFELPTESAKAYANMIGDAYALYRPQIIYDFAHVDLKNIDLHIQKGNIMEHFMDIFENANKRVYEGLKPDPEKIKVLKRVLKDWFEYENLSFTNPRNAALTFLGVMLGEDIITTRTIIKELKSLVSDAFKMSNPEAFRNYKEQAASERHTKKYETRKEPDGDEAEKKNDSDAEKK